MPERKTAIISGGLGDLGKAVGKHLAAEGYDVIALYVKTPRANPDCIAEFSPGRHEAILCDISDEAKTRKIIEDVARSHAKINVAVHAAVDPIIRKNVMDTSGSELRDQFKTGFFGGFNFLEACAEAMKSYGEATIIGILSRPAQFKTKHPRMGGYILAKHALRGLLRELSEELAPFQINVNAIAPDFLNTNLNADLPEQVRAFIEERGVAGSIRSIEDAASAVSFLCSKNGRGINGKIFSPDEEETEDL